MPMNFENSTIGSYRIIKRCGAGTYGEVYLAKDTFTNFPVALKTILADTKMMQRELRGLINYRKCRHDNLLKIHHIAETDEVFYYVMDLADNINQSMDDYEPDTLSNRLKRRSHLTAAEILVMHDELLAGLQILHSNNIIHRDIKPDNIMWVNGKAVLGDVGLVAENIGSTMVGTPEFMSPALLSRKRSANESDDLYSLSRVLYCAFSGLAPERFPELPPGLLKNDPDAPIVWNKILALDSKSAISGAGSGRKRSDVPARRYSIFRKHPALTTFAVTLFFCVAAMIGLFSLAGNPAAPVQKPAAILPPPAEPGENAPAGRAGWKHPHTYQNEFKEALEGTSGTYLHWTSGGASSGVGENIYWLIVNDDGHNDNICVSSGGDGGGESTSWLKTSISGPCKISFYYKVQTHGGSFSVTCDDRELYLYSGVTGINAPWEYAEYDIPAGEHMIKFTYTHPGTGYTNMFNGVRLDNFRVTPL
ncbi:MAG: serine/threonine protein kinase [Lentisphaerae bacterium]|nr:serine/threonine protein kinase [Lentisphaerota bacterium]